ncbi:MAG: S-methyl-5-thioribose-1-phosphate isomerase [Deltaproteobacteria bacterium]|jgi:methylthioribose-1-phosphate isomerase|nr:S-methyl-5-thioribose-1-phosphate isomerase [Deltaproteobacteria bacterium]
MFVPFRFNNEKLHLLDQRQLPDKENWLVFSSAREVANAIKNMAVRGAPAIGCCAAWGFYLGARKLIADQVSSEDFARKLAEIKFMLASTRPTAVNLFWALEEMEKINPDSQDSGAYLDALKRKAKTIEDEDRQSCQLIGTNALSLFSVEKNWSILTHCNAGALATAGYGTALGVIRSLHSRGSLEMVWADETRPRQQGARLTVWELMKDDIPVTLVADTASGYLLSQNKVDAIITGADRIADNGDTANKIGTYTLAVLAKRHNIPFYVAAPLSTIDTSLKSGDEIEIEQRDPREVTFINGKLITPAHAQAFNPAFDLTPKDLITAIITEKGIIYPGTGSILQQFS